MPITTPLDIVDKEIEDNKAYLRSLVSGADGQLGRAIEAFIQKKTAAPLDSEDQDTSITDQDIYDYHMEQERQKQEDELAMEGGSE